MRCLIEKSILAADGTGQKRIAWALNAEGAPSPQSQQGRPRSWAGSSVHAILNRPIYRGEVVYNRTRKRDQWGQKRHTRRPESEWMRVSMPELRIVDQQLWDAAHAQIAEHRRAYVLATGGLRGGRTPVESKYALVGFARFACCGGGLTVRTHNHGSSTTRRRAFFYGCTTRQYRGPTACDNGLQIPMELIDAPVLGCLRDLLKPHLIDHVIAGLRTRTDRGYRVDSRDRLAGELAAVEGRIGRLTEAIVSGTLSVPEVVAQLQEAQRRRAVLNEDLTVFEERNRTAPAWTTVKTQARALLQNWRELLAQHPTAARPVLRSLLEGRKIRFTPIVEADRRGYRFEGDAGLGGLLEGVVACQGGWRPHRDLHTPDTRLLLPFSGEVILVRWAA